MDFFTAAELAEAVRSGKLSAVESTKQALRRLELHDSKIGAFQVVRAERALAEAAALDASEMSPDPYRLELTGST